MAVVRNVVVRVGADISALTRGLQSAQKALHNAGKTMNNIGTQMSKYLSLPILALGGYMVKTATDFEAAMSNIKAVTGASAEEMKAFNDIALEMGAKTKFSALESANAIEELAKAGLTTSQILDGGLAGALTLAAAGEIDVAQAAEIASIALNAFKNDNLTVSKAADLLAGAANASATDVLELQMGLSQVATVASGVGMSFKDTVTALSVFAQNGLKGSDAGTSLKSMLLTLSPATDTAAKMMSKLGIITADGTNTFFDAKGELKKLSDISEVLKTALGKLTSEQRQMALKTMFGTDAIRVANIMFTEGSKGANDMAGAIQKISATDVAKTKMDNLKGSLDGLSGSIETLGIMLGQKLLPGLKSITDMITSLINSFSEMSPETQNTIMELAGLTAGLGILILAIGGILEGLSVAAGVLATLGMPIALAIGAIMGLVAALVILYNHNENMRIGMNKVFDRLKEAWDNFIKYLRNVWDRYGTKIIKTIIVAWKLLETACIPVMNTLSEVFTQMLKDMNGTGEGTMSLFDSIGRSLVALYDICKPTMMAMWALFGGFTVALAGMLASFAPTVLSITDYIVGFNEAINYAMAKDDATRKAASEKGDAAFARGDKNWEIATKNFNDAAQKTADSFVKGTEDAIAGYDAAVKTIKDIWESQNKVVNLEANQFDPEGNPIEKITTESPSAETESTSAKNKLASLKEELTNVQIPLTDLGNESEDVFQKMQDDIKSMTDQFVNFVGIFDKVQRSGTGSGTSLISRLKKQVTEMQSWSTGMNTIQEKLGAGHADFINVLRKMGPSSARQIVGLSKLDTAKLDEYATLFGQKEFIAGQQAEQVVKYEHSGTIQVKGVDTAGQTQDVVNIITTDLVSGAERRGKNPSANKLFKQ